jgi:hypothetical protein
MFVPDFIAVKRTPPTKTFLSQLIVPTKLNIAEVYARMQPLHMGNQDFSASR